MSAHDRIARRVAGFPTTVFSEFSLLAARHQAVNLGQGFPDFDGPDELKAVAIRAITDGANQYAMGSGSPELRQAIAAHAKRFYAQEVDPETMVTVTSGATEAIFDAVLALVDPGEEVILFEPYYDSYRASVELAGAVPRYVLLRPPDDDHSTWWYEPSELEQCFNTRTRLVVVNSPHNPTGKVFTRAELEHVAGLCLRWNALALSDEVYEHLVFAPARHVRLATLPDMADRTITVSSGGKSFSFTGWKIGWAIASPKLRHGVQQAHQFVTFATSTPMQRAIAAALALPDQYFAELRETYLAKRDLLHGALEQAGLRPIAPEGTYFIMARTGADDDVAYCRWLTTEVGVAAIPPSAFYSDEHKAQARGLARFAFCKTTPVLEEAARRLGKRGGRAG